MDRRNGCQEAVIQRGDPGVVDEVIEPAVALPDFGKKALNRLLVRNVDHMMGVALLPPIYFPAAAAYYSVLEAEIMLGQIPPNPTTRTSDQGNRCLIHVRHSHFIDQAPSILSQGTDGAKWTALL